MAITENQIVSFEYEVKDTKSNEVVDSNIGQTPLVIMMGRQQIIPGLENHLATLAVGEKGDVLVKAEEAYGPYQEEAVQTLPREQFAGIELEEGMKLYGQGEDGQTAEVMVKSFNDTECVIDHNHPMAGKDLMFSVNVVAVRDASAEEAASGVPSENAPAEGGSCGTGCGCH